LGDPEAEVILFRLNSDLYELFDHAIDGTLDTIDAEWDRRAALGVVLAAAGYPEAPRKGDVIDGLDRVNAQTHPDVQVFHAGTAARDGATVVSGGRVLCVTALGDSVRLAQRAAYAAVADITFAGAQFRTDIGHRAMKPAGVRAAPDPPA
ncbi:MAG: phosphoribosylglycinamide synthetase C domain-containing protein, partial [Casimicrobiaceae bacterium]